MRQRALLFERLEVAEALRAFITHRVGSGEELYIKLEQVEGDLAAAQKVIVEGVEALKLVEVEKESVHAEADWLREEGKTTKAKCKEVEQENTQLKKKLEELWAGFTDQKKELEEEFQKQVDEMFFYGYRCCMKKNDITQDTHSFPSDDKGKVPDGSS